MKRKIYEYLCQIPRGSVTTYGQIAKAMGDRHLARYVGNVLHQNPDPEKYPCHRVVSSQGKLSHSYAFGGLDGQRIRLEREGVEVIQNCVDLKKYLYKKDL